MQTAVGAIARNKTNTQLVPKKSPHGDFFSRYITCRMFEEEDRKNGNLVSSIDDRFIM